MITSDTPETDAFFDNAIETKNKYPAYCAPFESFCQKLERERDEAREQNARAKAIISQSNRDYDEQIELFRAENAKLRDIAEWAVDNIFHKCTEDLIRAELKELKQLK